MVRHYLSLVLLKAVAACAMTKTLLRNSYLLATATQTISSFIWLALMARVLDSENLGRLIVIEALVVIISQASLFGVNHAAIRLFSQNAVKPLESLSALLKTRIHLYIATIIVSTIIAGCHFETANIWMIALWLISESVFILLGSAMRGSRSFQGYTALIFIRFATQTSIALLTYLFNLQPSLDEVIQLVVASITTSNLITTRALLKRDSNDCNAEATTDLVSENVEIGKKLHISNILSIAPTNLDKLLVSQLLGNDVLAQYAVLAKAASALSLAITPFNLWWPTEKYRALQRGEQTNYYEMVAVLFISSLFLLASILLIASPVISRMLSPGIEHSFTVVFLLALGIIFSSTASVLAPSLSEAGSERYILNSSIFAAAIFLLATLISAKYFESLAAPLGLALYGFSLLLIQTRSSWRRVKLPIALTHLLISTIFFTALFFFLSRSHEGVTTFAISLAICLTPPIIALCSQVVPLRIGKRIND